MKNCRLAVKTIAISLSFGSLLLINQPLVQAEKSNPKETILNEGRTPNFADPDLQEKQDEVWGKIVSADFSNKVDQKIKEKGYKIYNHIGEFDVNYIIVEIQVAEKQGESKVETIENIGRIVSGLAKENNLVPTICKVSFRQN